MTKVIVLDTETCSMDTTLEEVLASNMLTYDFGYSVVDIDTGEVEEEKSFVNADVFLGEKALMKEAYFSEKIPQYWKDIKNGSRVLTSWYRIKQEFLKDMKRYKVKQVFAHNMRFDYSTLNQTERWLTKSKRRYFFPYGTEICDTLKMARDVILKMTEYKEFCQEHELLTKNGRLSATAENLYRFLTNNPNFVESHTALEDVRIEREIMMYCFKNGNADMRIHLWE